MQSVGLITEYNPFHNGHRYHLVQSKRLTGADCVVVVMSGAFVQRGEPALLDKWARTEMALSQGADLVFEIPHLFACSSAPDFARGGVELLGAAGVSSLVFGSEGGELQTLNILASAIHAIPEKSFRSESGDCLSWPERRAELLRAAGVNENELRLLAQPNTILGLEYILANQRAGSPLACLTVQRTGTGYHDLKPSAEGIASATALRRMLEQGEKIECYVPEEVGAIIGRNLNLVVYPDKMVHALRMLIARSGISEEWGFPPGVDGAVEKQIERAENFADLCNLVKGRRLTGTRVARMLTGFYLGIREEERKGLQAVGPRYLRLLGGTEKGRGFLSQTRKQRTLPVLDNMSRAREKLHRWYGKGSEAAAEAISMLEIDVRTTRMHDLLQSNPPRVREARDYTTDPLWR